MRYPITFDLIDLLVEHLMRGQIGVVPLVRTAISAEIEYRLRNHPVVRADKLREQIGKQIVLATFNPKILSAVLRELNLANAAGHPNRLAQRLMLKAQRRGDAQFHIAVPLV